MRVPINPDFPSDVTQEQLHDSEIECPSCDFSGELTLLNDGRIQCGACGWYLREEPTEGPAFCVILRVNNIDKLTKHGLVKSIDELGKLVADAIDTLSMLDPIQVDAIDPDDPTKSEVVWQA